MLKSKPLLKNQRKQYEITKTTTEDIKRVSERMRYVQYIILGCIVLFLVFIIILILFLVNNYFHK